MSFRNRLPLILLIMSLMAMVGVGIGLFLWLDTVKQAEARQLHGNLDNGVGRIQSETALEFTAISVLFTYEVEEIGKLRNAAFFPALTRLIPGAYEKWRENTRFPDLIDTIFLVDRTGGGPPLYRYDDAERRFIPDAGDGSDFMAGLSIPDDNSGSYRIVSYPDGLALVIPIEMYQWKDLKDKEKVRVGQILVLLDREYFVEKIVAELFTMYLGSRAGMYSFAVVAEENDEVLFSSPPLDANTLETAVPPRVDRIVPLTAWISTGNSLLSDALSAAEDEESSILAQAILTDQIKDLFIRQWFALTTSRVPEKTSGRPVSTGPPADDVDHSGGLSLRIWHSAGSIEEAVRSVRNRRLAAGYSGLLCFALVAIVYYLLYRRAKSLRDREHEFVATVTHELRTPVSGVTAVADNLAEGIVSDPARVREYGRAILDHGRRLGILIDQVLLYAGLSQPGKSPPAERIDLDEHIRDVASRVPAVPRDRLIVHVQAGLPPYSGDATAIETVITNLLSNAAKHSGDAATITVNVYGETRRKRPRLVIRVSDTGPGIPKRDLGRVLEPFYRGKESYAKQIPGSGLGLSLVNRVVRTYGGTLSISSTAGRGTTVTVRLPFEKGSADER